MWGIPLRSLAVQWLGHTNVCVCLLIYTHCVLRVHSTHSICIFIYIYTVCVYICVFICVCVYLYVCISILSIYHLFIYYLSMYL